MNLPFSKVFTSAGRLHILARDWGDEISAVWIDILQ